MLQERRDTVLCPEPYEARFPSERREDTYYFRLVSPGSACFVPLCGYRKEDEQWGHSCVVYDNDGPVLYSFAFREGDRN